VQIGLGAPSRAFVVHGPDGPGGGRCRMPEAVMRLFGARRSILAHKRFGCTYPKVQALRKIRP
jgi:hypothetical protein